MRRPQAKQTLHTPEKGNKQKNQAGLERMPAAFLSICFPAPTLQKLLHRHIVGARPPPRAPAPRAHHAHFDTPTTRTMTHHTTPHIGPSPLLTMPLPHLTPPLCLDPTTSPNPPLLCAHICSQPPSLFQPHDPSAHAHAHTHCVPPPVRTHALRRTHADAHPSLHVAVQATGRSRGGAPILPEPLPLPLGLGHHSC